MDKRITNTTLKTSWDCWDHLQLLGGLDIALYDSALVTDLANALGLDSELPLQNQLKKKNISTEDFLAAFFISLKPYSMMMNDLLTMFESAQAVESTTGSLCIEFDFGHKIEGLSFDIRSFRVWQLTFYVKTEIDTQDALFWNHDYLISICNVLEKAFKNNMVIIDPLVSTKSEVADWLQEYNQKHIWPELLLLPPLTPPGEFRNVLDVIWRVWQEVVSASCSLGHCRDQLAKFKWEPPNEEINGWREPWLLKILDADNWASRIVIATYNVSQYPELWHDLVAELKIILNRIPKRPLSNNTRFEALQELLQIPLWKRRHDLYSAWVGSQIAAALGNDVKIHSYGGTLRYSFTGTHLSTLQRTKSSSLHLWSELRSPLANPKGKGRYRSIQPDYSLQLEPISYPESSRLVVECKQYLKCATRSFANALDDYASGRTNAVVVLVNYGPADSRILELITPDLRSRVYVIGELRPDNPSAISRFLEIVSAAIVSEAPPFVKKSKDDTVPISLEKTQTDCSQDEIKIVLSWGETPKDLDLHVWVMRENHEWIEISYQNMGSLENVPWAELDRDCKDGVGPETVVVRGATCLKCAVYKYSSDGSLAISKANICVIRGGAEINFSCPELGTGNWWSVFEYDLVKNRLQVLGKIGDSFYNHKGNNNEKSVL